MLERVANFDQTKMQITYLDPEFDNEQVQLDSLENLPSKARIIIRTLQNDGKFYLFFKFLVLKN